MAGRIVALLLALVAVASCSNVQFFNNRIVGGDVAPEGLAPWAVSLRSGVLIKSHFCGGSLISPTFVVTAAHCVDAVWNVNSLVGSLQVLSGTLSQNEGGVKSTVKQNFTHSAWDSYNIKNDIGIFELNTALELNAHTQPIAIKSAYIDGGADLTAVGWGLTRYPGISSSTVLKYLETPSISHDDCVSRRDTQAALTSGFFPAISTGEICTLHSVGQAVCQGDSGSALFDDEGLVGVVSWGVACATGFPDIFTRVSAYSDWVNNIIA